MLSKFCLSYILLNNSDLTKSSSAKYSVEDEGSAAECSVVALFQEQDRAGLIEAG